VDALDADSVDEPDEPDIPTRLGQVSEGLCRQPNPDGQLCAYERPCPHHAGVPAAVVGTPPWQVHDSPPPTHGTPAVDTRPTSTLQAELHRRPHGATQPAGSLEVEPTPEPDSGPGWDRETIDWLAAWLDDNGGPFGGNQLRALLADRDRIGREAMAAYSRARFAEAGRNALARRWDDLTEERDAARADRDAVRAEVQRMAGDVEDLRATVAMRDRQLREARDSLAAALERGVATPEQWQAEQSWPSWPTAGGPAPAARLVWAPQRPAERDAARAELATARVEIARLTDGWRTTDHLRDEWRQRADDATADLDAALVTIAALRDELPTARRDAAADALRSAGARLSATHHYPAADLVRALEAEVRTGQRTIPTQPATGTDTTEET
jgi:hypothetical protein